MNELLERRATIVARMREIVNLAEAENRDLTAEEQTEFDGLKADRAGLDTRIDRLGQLQDAEAAARQPLPAAGRRMLPGLGAPRVAAGDVVKEFESLAEFCHAVRFNPNDQRLHYVEGIGGAPELGAANEMRMDNGPTGGFMVPKTVRTNILSVAPQDALVRPRATIIGADPGSPDAAVGMPVLDQSGASQPASNFGGVSVSWINEGDTKPQTDAALREVELVPKEVAAHMIVTDKLLRNWQGARGFIDGLFRGAVAAAEDYAFIQGTGVGQPLGILNAGVLVATTRAGAGHIAFADIQNIMAKFMMGRQISQPVWSCSQSVLADLMVLKDGANQYIWQPNARQGFAGELMGYPLRINNRQPALGTKGDIILADWGYYLIKEGSGPFVASSEHVYFTSNKTVIKIFYNVDGAPWMFEPHTEENGYDVSPFITVAT